MIQKQPEIFADEFEIFLIIPIILPK